MPNTPNSSTATPTCAPIMSWPTRPSTKATAAADLAASLGLRGADAVYVAAAEYLHLPLCTLDDDQARRAAYRVEVTRLGVGE